MSSERFEAALERAAKTWKAYFAAICILHVTVMIDALSGFPFLEGRTPIDLAGFEVVREALSATYGLVFSLFVATVYLESNLLKARSSAADLSSSCWLSVVDLWFLSPFSESPLLRAVFWFLFVDGFLVLGLFSFAHLAVVLPPDSGRMSLATYVAIGVVDLILMIICIPFAYYTYRNFEHVRVLLLNDNRIE